jgi:hypothetical protein
LRTLRVKARKISEILILGRLLKIVLIQACLIVRSSQFRVADYAVRICNILEFVKCVRVLVRMVFLRQFVVLFLDISLAGSLRNP